MAYRIDTNECIACGICAGGCPVDAIKDGGSCFIIDASGCIDCGACADACPVGAPKDN